MYIYIFLLSAYVASYVATHIVLVLMISIKNIPGHFVSYYYRQDA